MIVVAKGLGGDTELYFFYNNKKSENLTSTIITIVISIMVIQNHMHCKKYGLWGGGGYYALSFLGGLVLGEFGSGGFGEPILCPTTHFHVKDALELGVFCRP